MKIFVNSLSIWKLQVLIDSFLKFPRMIFMEKIKKFYKARQNV